MMLVTLSACEILTMPRNIARLRGYLLSYLAHEPLPLISLSADSDFFLFLDMKGANAI